MENDYESIEVPAVGEVRARKGTSTLELAGAAKFWHDKYKQEHSAGWLAGAVVSAVFTTAFHIALHIWIY